MRAPAPTADSHRRRPRTSLAATCRRHPDDPATASLPEPLGRLTAPGFGNPRALGGPRGSSSTATPAPARRSGARRCVVPTSDEAGCRIAPQHFVGRHMLVHAGGHAERARKGHPEGFDAERGVPGLEVMAEDTSTRTDPAESADGDHGEPVSRMSRDPPKEVLEEEGVEARPRQTCSVLRTRFGHGFSVARRSDAMKCAFSHVRVGRSRRLVVRPGRRSGDQGRRARSTSAAPAARADVVSTARSTLSSVSQRRW